MRKFVFCAIVFIGIVKGSLGNLVEKHHDEPEPHHDEENHEFEEILKVTKSRLNDKLDISSLREVLHRLNEQCLHAEDIFQAFEVNIENGLDENQFSNASIIIAYHLQSNEANSTCDQSKALLDVDIAMNALFPTHKVHKENVSSLVESISENGKFVQDEDVEECFGVADLISESTEDQKEIKEIVMNMVIKMARGLCFLPEPEFFQRELFEYLDPEEKQYVTEEVLEELLEKFNLGGEEENGHGGHGDENHEEDGDHDEEEDHDKEGDHDKDGDHDEKEPEDDDHHEKEPEDANHEDEDHRRKRRKRELEDDDHEDEDHEEEGHEEEGHEDEGHEDERHQQKCYSTSELLTIAGRQTDANGKLVLTRSGLINLCPAIIYQFITGACAEDSGHRTSTVTTPSYTTAQKYGYGTAAVFIISLLAFGGLLLFPSIGSSTYKMTMQFFIALGIGTLSGDALLHLIPEVVGLHGHEASGGEHDHGEEEEDKTYIHRLAVVVVGIYVFYLFENVLRLYNQLRTSNVGSQNHDEKGDHPQQIPTIVLHNHENEGKSTGGRHMSARASIAIAEGAGLPGFARKDSVKQSVFEEESETDPGKAVCCGVTPIGIMVLIGDALHNFGDGLALGVAFSSGWVGGIGTSIAIFCHELPHEFGDFAIYLKNGMSKWKALGFNFLAACCAFIGLYVGLSVSENPAARQWMLAVIAGMFLYIALVDVLHEMIEEVSVDHPLLQFFLQNLGMCLGWTILLLLALYEDDIRNALSG